LASSGELREGPRPRHPAYMFASLRRLAWEGVAVAGRSRIEWTQATWNPVTGCDKVSPGCTYCYAERMARRLHAMGNHRYRNGFRVTLHDDLLTIPLRWKTPHLVFVNSMSDLFHEDVPLPFIQRVFATMCEASQHTFQILTKRTSRLLDVAPYLPWPRNVWVGVSIENDKYIWRADHLRQVPAAVRFLSLEPLLGPVPSLRLDGIDWVIVGGESGPGARPLDPNWVRDVRDRSVAAGVAFFFKQWGGLRRTAAGRLLDGRTWDEFPTTGPRNAAYGAEPRFPHPVRKQAVHKAMVKAYIVRDQTHGTRSVSTVPATSHSGSTHPSREDHLDKVPEPPTTSKDFASRRQT